MSLACVSGGAMGLLNIPMTLVVKEMYDESILADYYIVASCLFGLGESIGSFAAGELFTIVKVILKVTWKWYF